MIFFRAKSFELRSVGSLNDEKMDDIIIGPNFAFLPSDTWQTKFGGNCHPIVNIVTTKIGDTMVTIECVGSKCRRFIPWLLDLFETVIFDLPIKTDPKMKNNELRSTIFRARFFDFFSRLSRVFFCRFFDWFSSFVVRSSFLESLGNGSHVVHVFQNFQNLYFLIEFRFNISTF